MSLPILSAKDRQRVLDASLPLQLLRAKLCESERPAGVHLEVYPLGTPEIQDRVNDLGNQAADLVTVSHPTAVTLAAYRQSIRYNERAVERGVSMTSLVDLSGGGPSAISELILASKHLPYYIGFGPMLMKVLDRRTVLLEGPAVEGARSLMLIERTEVVSAALHYAAVVKSCSVAVRDIPSDHVELTPRQHAIARLLAENQTDPAIARSLNVSVRTIRGDMATIHERFGATNRFAAGVRYAVLLSTSRSFQDAAMDAFASSRVEAQ